MAFFLFAAQASAASLGSTMALGVPAGFTGGVPSLDFATPTFLIQFHVLETIEALTDETLLLGGDLYLGSLTNRPIGGSWTTVVMPGVGVDVLDDPFTVVATGNLRLGVQTHSGSARVAAAVVPELGILTGDPDTELVVGGGVQFSLWFDVGK